MRWFLCEHDLEIERGRFSTGRVPHNVRYCKACVGQQLLGDEKHALVECERCWMVKVDAYFDINDTFEQEDVEHEAGNLYEVLAVLSENSLPQKLWRSSWIKVAKVMAAINEDLLVASTSV